MAILSVALIHRPTLDILELKVASPAWTPLGHGVRWPEPQTKDALDFRLETRMLASRPGAGISLEETVATMLWIWAVRSIASKPSVLDQPEDRPWTRRATERDAWWVDTGRGVDNRLVVDLPAQRDA
jgi:hypothetical protein